MSNVNLTEEQLAFFKKVLETLVRQLQGELKHEAAEMRDALPQDSEDAASEREEREIVELANQVEVEEIDQVYEALQRIGSGDFGKCQKCLGPVGYQRLRAVPYAKYCISCQSERESN